LTLVFGKAEGKGEQWHGHVTALTVAAEFRRIGLAKRLMNILELVSEFIYDGYFVDLFVRQGNKVAIGMYSDMGYITYRTVTGYYSGEEDGLDMHKALARDVEKKSMVPIKDPVSPNEIDY
jgi:N-terminal acetyltransferase B complex catalytic subunit